MDKISLVLLSIWAIALAFRCMYLEHRVDKDAKAISELTDLLNQSNVALANELANKMMSEATQLKESLGSMSGCNDPERMSG